MIEFEIDGDVLYKCRTGHHERLSKVKIPEELELHRGAFSRSGFKLTKL